MSSAKEIVTSQKLPPAIGPYSVGVKAGGFVFTAGQVGLDPATNQLVPGGVEAQTEQALKNLRTILEEAGTSVANIVKTTVFLQDINDYAAVNQVYAGFFDGGFPARSAVQVAALPAGAAVEIEAVALLGE